MIITPLCIFRENFKKRFARLAMFMSRKKNDYITLMREKIYGKIRGKTVTKAINNENHYESTRLYGR